MSPMSLNGVAKRCREYSGRQGNEANPYDRDGTSQHFTERSDR